MSLPREDTPLLIAVTSSSPETTPQQPHIRRRLFRQDHSKTLRFTLTRLCSLLSNSVVVMAIICAVAVPLIYLRSASNSSSAATVEVATPLMKGQMWRGGVSSNSIKSSSSSAPASDPILTIDEQFVQWDQWKQDITKALLLQQQKQAKADLLSLTDDSTASSPAASDTTTTSAATDDLQLQDASQEQTWNGNTTSTSTSTPTAFDKWWSNATALEREWWHKTTDVLRDWEHALADHSKEIWNETEQATEHATAELRNKTTTTKKTTTSSSSSKTAAAWLSPLPNLESAFTEDDEEEDSYDTLLYMNSSKAYSLLFYNDNTLHSQHYFSYQQGWDAQINQAYCGVASSAALLNSLPGVAHNPKILPIDPVYAPYPYATQTSILLPSLVQGDCVNQHVIRGNTSFSGILAAPFGLGMYQVQALLQCYLGASSNAVQIHHVIPTITSADPTSTSALAAEQRWIDGIRRVLVKALLSPQARVLINYNRAAAGQVGGGHWSPLASYHAGRDAFLLMDVAKYKYPAVWIPTSKLIAGMATVDGCSTWNFPAAQDSLPLDWLHPTSMDQYAQSMTRVACQAKYRGFIIVNMTSSGTTTTNSHR